MLEKIKERVIPYFIGFCFMVAGWYISILNVGLARFQTDVLFTKWTMLGLAIILIGAYMPGIYIFIKEFFKK
ncbi:MAG TPA: hypothetical protein PLD85_06770 [Spirochaetota bacterium]|nr:hypothetical protein [Spirochaetota bacterium]